MEMAKVIRGGQGRQKDKERMSLPSLPRSQKVPFPANTYRQRPYDAAAHMPYNQSPCAYPALPMPPLVNQNHEAPPVVRQFRCSLCDIQRAIH
jgi:hypothetical protein